MSGALLQAKNLFCERDDRILFEHLDFELNAGDIVQIEGANGAGKTTLLRILAGLSQAYEGRLLWKSQPLEENRTDYFSNLLYLGHKPGVKSVLSPLENLVSWMGIRRAPDLQAILDALRKVGLYGYEEVPCHSLSAGQNRRVALARLFLSTEAVWILDEAFTAIDLQGVANLEALMVERAKAGGAIILTTHHEFGLYQHLRKVTLGRRVSRESRLAQGVLL
ncbi:MAG: cytochrome c biogenesis heme-transporting ATPase CcmA [Hahellaceae bacterium]|nr:cytochrome c biogenesis heme-transporting ATPase CcmA [Hahellaceae bacterium]